MKPSDSGCDERFQSVAGLGRVFDPACLRSGAHKKHQCPDCHFCQGCSESRCQACRGCRAGDPGPSGRKLSLREQICLYEAINRGME